MLRFRPKWRQRRESARHATAEPEVRLVRAKNVKLTWKRVVRAAHFGEQPLTKRGARKLERLRKARLEGTAEEPPPKPLFQIKIVRLARRKKLKI
jgi:hypothetical protein